MKKLLIICVFLALPLAGSYCAAAEGAGNQGRGPAEKMHHEGHFAVIAKVLRLSNAQQAKIKEILKADCEEQAALMKQLAENRQLFREKTHAETLDEAGVRALAEKQGKLMARMIVSPAMVRNKIRAVLTPEQRDLEARIQPLLAPVPAPRSHFRDEEHFSGAMGHRPPDMDEEYPIPMQQGPPFCEEDRP